MGRKGGKDITEEQTICWGRGREPMFFAPQRFFFQGGDQETRNGQTTKKGGTRGRQKVRERERTASCAKKKARGVRSKRRGLGTVQDHCGSVPVVERGWCSVGEKKRFWAPGRKLTKK